MFLIAEIHKLINFGQNIFLKQKLKVKLTLKNLTYNFDYEDGELSLDCEDGKLKFSRHYLMVFLKN
jgi:hypothetical protein